ncbi:MAG: fatty acid desaturase [Sandaracinaceae bacterium]|nr:fatty acid desaturase [Sandaracinaceae bacterium]
MAQENAPPPRASLSAELDALHRTTRSRMDEADIQHIENVAAYSRAIDERARQLIMNGHAAEELWRGTLLRALHVVLEFSELGHNILHGGYDHLNPDGPFHSDRWDWDFVADPSEWKVMHHRNHHPFTNIVGKDHDLGYTVARLFPGQEWRGHHLLQSAVLGLFVAHLYPFALYTATSAARVAGRPVFTRDTFAAARARIARHARRNYLNEPRQAGRNALRTLVGNYLGTTLGYDLTLSMLLIEHHAPSVEVFVDPGPDETRDAYFERQLRATTNFVPNRAVEAYCTRLLHEEVAFANPPGFEVFYGGLDTHVEHHLFPDLPCKQQREIAPAVRAICARYGLPYNTHPIEDMLPKVVVSLARHTAPLAEHERARDLVRRPRALVQRLRDGVGYTTPRPTDGPSPYLRKPRYFNARARVLRIESLARGSALRVQLCRPFGWEQISWAPGAFVSLRVNVHGEELIRQYSLMRESPEGSSHEPLEFTVKRVAGGRVSNHLNDTLREGQWLTLVGPPENTGGLAQPNLPSKALYLAGGVGITPILAMLRRQRRIAPGRDATLLYFNRDAGSALFLDELRELTLGTGVRVACFTDRPAGAPGQAQLSQELLAREVPDLADREVFACAPPGFLAAAAKHVAALGLDPARFHVEHFSAPPNDPRPLTGRTHTVRFLRSALTLQVDEATTLLSAGRTAGIQLPSGCERGLCRACVCPKLGGDTADTVHPERHRGPERITLCNTFPLSAVDLDA